VGVFVNNDFDEICDIIGKYSLDMVQLHGNESPEICCKLKDSGIKVIKAFNIGSTFEFKICSEYTCTDYFLFDRFTSKYGGSGNKFDWNILVNYELDHPFFLSGGIGPDDVYKILEIAHPAFSGIDLNSKFEIMPGLKDVKILKKFINDIRDINKAL
jgi:phosphoribosylanthranilate isomerase